MIFVTVGTHEQPFNRLIQKIDRHAKSALTNYRKSCDDYGTRNNFNT